MARKTKKKQKKSDTQKMNDALREKAGVTTDDADLERVYIEGLEVLNEFMDEVIAEAEELEERVERLEQTQKGDRRWAG